MFQDCYYNKAKLVLIATIKQVPSVCINKNISFDESFIWTPTVENGLGWIWKKFWNFEYCILKPN